MTPGFPNGGSTLTNTGDMLGALATNLSQPIALPPREEKWIRRDTEGVRM